MKHDRCSKVTYVTFSLLYCTSIYAEPAPQLLVERTDASRPTLLVLGSAHFSNPGLDNIDVEVDDVLADTRQSEIQALAEKLAEFRPTHIAVEVLHSNQDRFNSYYQDYVNGAAELDRSEASQIGLRLAKMLGHEHVYAVDWQGAPPGGFTDDYNWHDYGQANGHNDRVEALSNPEILGIGGYIQPGKRSIMEWIIDMNSEDALLAFHRMGSTPILRTLQKSLIIGKRSVYVEAKKFQSRVQARGGGADPPARGQLRSGSPRAGHCIQPAVTLAT